MIWAETAEVHQKPRCWNLLRWCNHCRLQQFVFRFKINEKQHTEFTFKIYQSVFRRVGQMLVWAEVKSFLLLLDRYPPRRVREKHFVDEAASDPRRRAGSQTDSLFCSPRSPHLLQRWLMKNGCSQLLSSAVRAPRLLTSNLLLNLAATLTRSENFKRDKML